MGAGEKNGIRTGEEEGEGRDYKGHLLGPTQVPEMPPSACPLRWAQLDLGQEHGAGRAQ